ncbi:hypothetical protein M3J09_007518 [Ascochyta lentis]
MGIGIDVLVEIVEVARTEEDLKGPGGVLSVVQDWRRRYSIKKRRRCSTAILDLGEPR